jgi:hypothetical protein
MKAMRGAALPLFWAFWALGGFLLLTPAAAIAKPAGCVVDGKTVEAFPVTVQAKGGPALTVRVRDVAASARIPETGPATVEVQGALAFSGTTTPEKLPLKPKERLDAANGMLRLGGGSGHVEGHGKGRWLEGDALLEGIRFRNVRFPCDGLTLDPVSGPATPVVENEEDVWIPSGKVLKLRFAAGSGPTMEVVLTDPSDLELHPVEKSGKFIRVSRRFRDGSYVNGWAASSDLKRPDGRGELTDLQPPPRACSHAPEAKPGTRLATAVVAAGTEVSFDRLFTWATVRGGDKLTVRLVPGERWVELVGVPGVANADDCENTVALDEAWVPRTAVKLPEDSSPDAGAPK